MDTRNTQPVQESGDYADGHYREPGLGTWIQRNSWLLVRLFMVMVFTFGASLIASNFSYGLEGAPTKLSVEQINNGQLPAGVERGDYVQITGTPDFGPDTSKVGVPESGIGVSARYSTSYFYFKLKDTNNNLLIQTAQTPPDVDKTGTQIWKGKLETVKTVIFFNTTQDGLKAAGLPHKQSIPVIETGDTPQYYRQIFPAYAAVIGIWLLSVAWLLWKKNKPFLGL